MQAPEKRIQLAELVQDTARNSPGWGRDFSPKRTRPRPHLQLSLCQALLTAVYQSAETALVQNHTPPC